MQSFLAGLLLLMSTAATARAACPDPTAVAAIRASAAAECDCATATNHRQHVKCVAGVTKAAVKSGMLPQTCKGAVVRCAVKSTCGKPGFVTCCRTNARGLTKCTIKPNASKCVAPKGSAACVGLASSCCDTCGAGSCPLATTTTVPGGATTTTLGPPQMHTVMVGDGGLVFTPATLTIHVGDTVHWVWASNTHSVVSGTSGTADGRFCSPNNMNCGNPPVSNTGATFDHTFTTAGAFPYYCSVHVLLGMTGTIKVR